MTAMVERALKALRQHSYPQPYPDEMARALAAALDLTAEELEPLKHDGDTSGAWKYDEGVADTLAHLKALAQGERTVSEDQGRKD